MTSNHEIEEIHSKLLVLLKAFHEICTSNDIKYSLHGGTLLGAIREHGFIPWDDDADVTLTREEYKKLSRVMKELDDSDFTLDEIDDKIPRFVAKQGDDSAVWIDVFIYDYISEKKFSQKLKIGGITFLSGLMRSKESMKLSMQTSRYSKIKHILYYIAYLMGRPFSPGTRRRMFMKFCEKRFCGKRKYIHRSNDLYVPTHIILPASTMNSYKMVQFEDTQLMVSEAHHEILESSYGSDYMTPKRAGNVDVKAHDIMRDHRSEKD